ncbi:MAG: GT4 family glycosyltransferase PelF [Eubacteriales bacterium]|nr:GT4 family glycosyltransferase PelF [Eubacteriales bacterium]
MRICVILEGCYPYVTGGVSSWMHQYIQAMPQHEFVVWAINADPSQNGKFRYALPENVAEVRELSLTGTELPRGADSRKLVLNEEELRAMHALVECGRPDWEVLFHIFQDRGITPVEFLSSEYFVDILTDICRQKYPYTAFSDYFHTVRSMLLPLLCVMCCDAPKADVYHTIATGYAGVLARLGAYCWHAPFLLTEHGIYTREREEEIIRADWVLPDFKDLWIRFFYMLSSAAYDGATMVTSLFARAGKTQIEIGADPAKCRSVANGIHYDRFCGIPERNEDGPVQMGAILRIAPIKDVKTMLYAFAEVEQKIPGVKLFIAGPEDDPEYARECRDLVRQLRIRNAIFMGTINVLDYMGEFDFTVLSSISEGQPLSVLESFAAGRPCVTTDVGCCKELIYGEGDDRFGQAGYCVPPMQPHALARAMEDLCRNRARRLQMGRAGKQRAERYFRHEDMIRNYLDTYEEVFRRWESGETS